MLDDDHFAAGRVKFRAFIPPKDEIVLSVGRTQGVAEPEVWVSGDTHVATDDRIIYARGDFRLEHLGDVRANDNTLFIVPDEPPPRHANVTGWPPPERKEVRKNLAQQLAARATLVVR